MKSKKTGTILVVEDDTDARDALCAMLESLGHKPVAFSSGKAALQEVKKHKFDVALLDIMMPEMNGYQLLEELKKIPETANIPVIMVTARDDQDEILEGYHLGADYYITKPYTMSQIEYGISLYLE